MSYADEMFGFAGKTIAITGAGGVIAGAMAGALLKAGGNVSLWAHRKESGETARAKLAGATGAPERLLALEADAADRASVGAALEKTEQRFGAVHVLVNCAGGNRGKSPFLEM